MTTVNEIIDRVSRLSGHPFWWDEGLQHGSAERGISGATVCWMPSPEAIESAGRNGHQLLIAHESLYYPYDAAVLKDQPPGWEQWLVNRQRRGGLEKYGLTFLRVHGSADDISVLEDFAAMLKVGQPVYSQGWVRVYQIAPCTLGELLQHVKNCTGMGHLRVSPAGSMDRIVSRVGLPWGGLGLVANVGYQQMLIEQGCDVFIAGETDNYGFRFAQECGIPMIETSHEISENPGMRRFTSILAKAFPDVTFDFFENPCVWQWA